METSLIIAGFGGQGALFAGQLLAYAAMETGKEATWIPSYGPEMRGGTAHCTVIVSDEPIGAPLVHDPQCVIAMNLPSMDKYELLLRASGILIYDGDLIQRPLVRSDIHAIAVPAQAIARRCGSQRLVNVLLLGSLLAVCSVVDPAAVECALHAHLPERHAALLAPNIAAFRAGSEYVASCVPRDVQRMATGSSPTAMAPIAQAISEKL